MVLIRWEMSIQEWIKILWIFFDSELVTHPRRKWASLPSWIYLFTETTIKENPSLSPAWFCLFALLRINKSEQWACYPVSLKSNSFRLIVRCIVITVTCPCRGLALNPDELLSGREGDVASFGGDWTSPPVSGLQPLVLPDLPGASRDIQYCWATEDTGGATCGLSQLQQTVCWAEAAVLEPLLLHPSPCLPLPTLCSLRSVLRQWLPCGQGCCFGSMLVTGSVAPWSKWWVSPIVGPWQVISPAIVRRLPAIWCHSICGWNKLDLTVCIMVGQWEASRSATPSCGP